jgi:hypothetical protein
MLQQHCYVDAYTGKYVFQVHELKLVVTSAIVTNRLHFIAKYIYYISRNVCNYLVYGSLVTFAFLYFLWLNRKNIIFQMNRFILTRS